MLLLSLWYILPGTFVIFRQTECLQVSVQLRTTSIICRLKLQENFPYTFTYEVFITSRRSRCRISQKALWLHCNHVSVLVLNSLTGNVTKVNIYYIWFTSLFFLSALFNKILIVWKKTVIMSSAASLKKKKKLKKYS